MNSDNKDGAESAKAETLNLLKDIHQMIKNGTFRIARTDDDPDANGFDQNVCPHHLCDGSGYIKKEVNGKTYSSPCQCYNDFVMKRKLAHSNFPPKFYNVSLSDLSSIDDKISLAHLKPKLKPEERKTDKRKNKQDEESPEEYIKRFYDEKLIAKGALFFADNYVKKSLLFIGESPRARALNLMLMGEPGKGKTHLACAIAKEFLLNNKSVYFRRMQSLLDDAYTDKLSIKKLARSKDLIVIDEFGHEYHTDSRWALKQIQDLFKERQEVNLPLICTTNFYPHELSDFYEGSLMSAFNGTFIMMLMQGDIDLRVLDANNFIGQLDFLSGQE